MENEFENALQALLNFECSDANPEEKYSELFRTMIMSSMKICSETDYSVLVQKKIESIEKKFGVKVDASDETDPYRRLREVMRFEMAHEAILNNKEFEICCTDKNLENAMAKIRGELEEIVPDSQKQVVDSIGSSLYAEFTKYLVCTTFDMIADIKIYEMKEFHPLQINAIGKELRTTINMIRQQSAKPQKSRTVTDWFRLMMIQPAFLFRKLYAVSMEDMFEYPQPQFDTAAMMFESFYRTAALFCPGDEYGILYNYLVDLQLDECFTIRPKEKPHAKPIVN